MITARTMKVFLSALAAGVALFGSVQTATAALLRWNLQRVTFADGAAATGFFLADIQGQQGAIVDFDVKLTGGKYASFEYTPQNSSGNWRPSAAFFETATRQLVLRAASSTQSGTYRLNSINGGGHTGIDAFDDNSFEVDNLYPQDGVHIARWVRTGSITTGIPKPPGALVRWTLDGVKFDNGGTATGSFVYDASTGTVMDFDVHLAGLCAIFECSNGPVEELNQPFDCQPGCWKGNIFPGPSPGTLYFSIGNGANPAGARSLNLLTGKPLTDSGGTVPLIVGGIDEDCCGQLTGSWVACCYSQVHSGLIAGALIGTLVPEPSEALLFSLGLAALVAFSARRRH